MKRLPSGVLGILLSFTVFVVAGFAPACRRETQGDDPARTDEWRRVAFAVVNNPVETESRHIVNEAGSAICTTTEIGILCWGDATFDEYFRLSSEAILDLRDALGALPEISEPGVGACFSEFLACVTYLDAASNALFGTAISVIDSTVHLAYCEPGGSFWENGRLWFRTTNYVPTIFIRRPAYCRDVLDLMLSQAPHDVRQRLREKASALEGSMFPRKGDMKWRRQKPATPEEISAATREGFLH